MSGKNDQDSPTTSTKTNKKSSDATVSVRPPEEKTSAASNSALHSSKVNQITEVFYGGRSAHEIFQRGVREAIPQLSARIHSYRAGDRTNVEDIIQLATLTRRSIAFEAGTEDAEEFGLFRKNQDSEFATTGTHEPRYSVMRSYIQEEIRKLLKTETRQMSVGGTRIQLREISLQDWRCFFTQEPSAKASKDYMLDRAYAYEFLEIGCCSLMPGENVGFIDYKDAITALIFGRMGEPQLRSKSVAPPGVEPYTQVTPTCFSKAPRFFQVDITHGTTKGPAKGYGFMAMIPHEVQETGDFPVMIYHTENRYIKPHEALYLAALENAIKADSKDAEDLKKRIARFCFRWTRVMPLVRGSASVMEDLISPALYEAHGYKAANTRPGVTIDHMGYMYWIEEEFVEAYMQAVQVIPLNDRSNILLSE
ncbi:MAG: hypothetical protein JSR85_06640 [Proteobacteria bacterium]|nr:hypothetical protein [Pseudomonadota bacterium]